MTGPETLARLKAWHSNHGGVCVTCVTSSCESFEWPCPMARALEQIEELREAVVLAKEGCADCGGSGSYATPIHVCGGDPEMCARRCPEAEQTQCERCFRADEGPHSVEAG